jgi:hypothetical protein
VILGIASPQAHPPRRIIRIGGIGGIAEPLNIPLAVALDDADITNLRSAVVQHVQYITRIKTDRPRRPSASYWLMVGEAPRPGRVNGE